ncbi:hypothetical protein [Paenibacillus hexagrammi]|uniref:Uncharacterized protein n=1 Tax=Paenibacillus hexagrammi TaxID=2908839 RepID=A0ABY3SN56_9BACL|nr:hypothetical protein [Paenibacillus sp. YPD9-1]UJF34407.1 hypothetical protein L0M14_04165 [Paenibacillus sp. YPD9-1]
MKPNQAGSTFRIMRLSEYESQDESGLLAIVFEPGDVSWQRKMLYFHIEDIVTTASIQPHELSASIAALPFDLKPHPSKKGWVGISLRQLAARIEQLSVTTAEINRIIIRMDDLQQIMPSSRKLNSSVQGQGQRIQA